MKKLFAVLLFSMSVGTMAQTAANNNANSSTTTSALGNNQAVTFVTSTPAETYYQGTTTINSTSNSTNTNHNINTGTSTNIIDYQGEYTIKNVPSVSGPNLTTSNDTCMGSTSGSANGAGFGLSFGSTWTDEHCKRLKMSRELWNKGMKAASLAMDCMDAGARIALELTGTKCPQSMTMEERRAAFGPTMPASAAAPIQGLTTAKLAAQKTVAPVVSPSPAQAPENMMSGMSPASILAVRPSSATQSDAVEPASVSAVSLSSQTPTEASKEAGPPHPATVTDPDQKQSVGATPAQNSVQN